MASHYKSVNHTVRFSPGETNANQPSNTRSSLRASVAFVALAAFWIAQPIAGFATGRASDDGTKLTSLDAGGAEYRLGPHDKLRITVLEWRPAKDELHAWTALNGEYLVGASGRVSLPIVGEIAALDKSPSDLATMIAVRLQQVMGLAAAPDASVAVVGYRPFYLVGDVEKSGEYEFRPGLTVLKAIGLGGGLYRGRVAEQRLERDVVSAQGEIERLTQERGALLVRRARLETELNGGDDVPCPTELRGGKDVGSCATVLIAQERRIHVSRRRAFEMQQRTLHTLKSFLERESAALVEQKATHAKQLGYVEQELDSVRSLTRKGLATAPRRLGLERNLAQLEGSALQFDRDIMRIRQEISRTEISIAELEDKRNSEIASEIQSIEIKLGENQVRMMTAQGLLAEAIRFAPAAMRASLVSTGEASPIYTIVRSHAGVNMEIPASESTILQPGDTLKITVHIPANANPPPQDVEASITGNGTTHSDLAMHRSTVERARGAVK